MKKYTFLVDISFFGVFIGNDRFYMQFFHLFLLFQDVLEMQNLRQKLTE